MPIKEEGDLSRISYLLQLNVNHTTTGSTVCKYLRGCRAILRGSWRAWRAPRSG